MPDLPPTDPAPAPTPAPNPHTPFVCEHCECTLAADGKVLKRSEKARQQVYAEDTIANLRRDLDTATTRANELAAQVQALTPKEKAGPRFTL